MTRIKEFISMENNSVEYLSKVIKPLLVKLSEL